MLVSTAQQVEVNDDILDQLAMDVKEYVGKSASAQQNNQPRPAPAEDDIIIVESRPERPKKRKLVTKAARRARSSRK